jgi:amidophosphoribosyltransferase
MCGVSGIVGKTKVNQDIYDSLMVLQHRGQDAAGIMTCDDGKVYLRKGNGLVRDVIRADDMFHLLGNMGIGHVRYPTAGSSSAAEAQPFYVNSPYGLSIAHNGNLINSEELSCDLIEIDRRHLNTNSDSEVLLNVFAHELQYIGKAELTPDDIFKAVKGLYQRCQGAYAVLIMIAGVGIVGFRDPTGIRPLVYGKRNAADGGEEYMIASESVALDALDFEMIADVAPGEAIFISEQGEFFKQQCQKETNYMPCLFEYVYLARPDSLIDQVLVYKFRMSLGHRLAEKIQKEFSDHDIDVVIPIPDSSRGAALSLAQTLGLKYREGFVKNRYIGRTFIMPGQKIRKKSVRQKLNAIGLEFKDKNVLLVDDSIVRGTTSEEIIQMARDAGAKKVYFASAAPEVRYPNVYGIDMPSAAELVAHDRTVEEIAKKIGADYLIFQDLSELYQAVQEGNASLTEFEDSVFTGNYKAGGVTKEYLTALEAKRNDKQKQNNMPDAQIIEMFNGG